MKRILTLILIMALALTVMVSCDKLPWGNNDTNNENTGNENTGNENTGDENTGNENNGDNTPVVDEDLKAAYDFIKMTYKTLNVTNKSFQIMKNAPVGDKNFPITWAVDNSAITITDDGDYYLVNIPELDENTFTYTLSFSIENEVGEKREGSFTLTVPVFEVNTFAQYAEAADGTALVVRGIITGFNSKADGDKDNSIYMQDLNNEGGYYVYALEADPTETLAIGMTIEVRGEKATYSGTYEIKNASVTVIDETIKTVTPVDITDIYTNAAGLDAAELAGKQGMLVTIKGVTVGGVLADKGYYYFELAGKQTYVRISTSNNCTSKKLGEEDAIIKTHADNYYNKADVTGLITVYNSLMYLSPVSADCFSNFTVLEKPDSFKVDVAYDSTKISTIIQKSGSVTLPTAGTEFDGAVAIAWSLVSGDATLNGNTITYTVAEDGAAKTVVLKATFTLNDVTKEKEYTVTVKGIDTITLKDVDDMAAGMLSNEYTEELFYIQGVITQIVNDTYGNLYIEADGYTLYIYGLNDANGNKYADMTGYKPQVGDTIKVLSVVGKYGNDSQLKSATLVYCSGDTGEDPVDPTPTIEVEVVDLPKVGVAYKLGLFHTNFGYNVFFNGKEYSASQPFYLGETDNAAEAVDVYLEAVDGVEGAYRLYFYNNGTKTYIRMYPRDNDPSSGKGTMEMTTSVPAEYFTYSTEYKTLIYTDSEGHQFFMGSSGTYKSISTSAISYITSETNYIAHFYGEPHVCDYNELVETINPTCTEAGYSIYKCECGKTTEVAGENATGHQNTETKEATSATCVATGNEAGVYCNDCNTYIEGGAVIETVACSYNEDNACIWCGASSHTCDFSVETEDKKAATCLEDGYTVYACTFDGCIKTNTVVANATNHEGTTEDREVVEATSCKAGGITAGVYCTACETYIEGGEATSALAHKDEEGDDFKCDYGCNTVVEPADGTVLTIEQAHKLGVLKTTTNKIVLTGKITGFYNNGTTYGNVYIEDENGKSILIYGMYAWGSDTSSTSGRYDKFDVKPGIGDTITVYGIMTSYNGTAQMKNSWINLDEFVPHTHDYSEGACDATSICSICNAVKGEHSYDEGVVTTPATCIAKGVKTYTCACTDAKTEAIDMLEHSYTGEGGVCVNGCGETEGNAPVAPEKETFMADLGTLSGNQTYGKYTTTGQKWVANNAQVLEYGTGNSGYKYNVIPSDTKAVVLNGKTSAVGSLVSPTLSDGISKISFSYANCYSESNGVDITISIKQNGVVVASKKLDNNSVTKLTAYEFVWDLEAEGVAVTGDFTIEITNNSPSNNTGNKDRVAIWYLEWTNNPTAA